MLMAFEQRLLRLYNLKHRRVLSQDINCCNLTSSAHIKPSFAETVTRLISLSIPYKHGIPWTIDDECQGVLQFEDQQQRLFWFQW